MTPRYLADKSALARLPRPQVDRRLTPLLLAGDVARCSIIDLELLYSARSHADFVELLADRRALPLVQVEQVDFDRAIAVMELLARLGKHRGVSIPDLLIAAPEERPHPDCAEAVADGLQGPTINQVVASVAASFVERLLAGTCRWMASYFDLDDGTLRCLPADPKLVAEIAGLHVNAIAPPASRRHGASV